MVMAEGFTEQRFPPGFRFHPTDEELFLYYLKRKICQRRILLDVIGETDVYKWDPDDLPELSKLKTGDLQWFFFSPRDRKYPTGGRKNRATKHGYWKATGKDRIITCNSRDVGVKKTLVFYKGRAPTGERTDWVMHEYTMDEVELAKCQSAQDYYALYKVFKKSGPGPKNGEQYGAPFNEEDWADDEHVDQEKSRKNVNDVWLIDDPKPIAVLPPPVDGLEEFLKHIADEPLLTELLPVDNSYEGRPQLQEATEVTSAPVNDQWNTNVVEEDFLEDFLEINDLDKPVENLGSQQFVAFGGLNGFELYQDATMLVHDAEQSANYVANDSINMLSTDFSDLHQMINNQQLYLDADNEFNHEPWSHDPTCSVVNPTEESQTANLPLPSGVVYGNHLENHPVGANSNLNQNNLQDDATNSSFSSALWAFVESIPATPASAAESALVNKAFEQMSSFGKLKLNARNNMKVAAGNTSATSSRCSGKSKNRLFCFSLLGVLCAVLWMFISREKYLQMNF